MARLGWTFWIIVAALAVPTVEALSQTQEYTAGVGPLAIQCANCAGQNIGGVTFAPGRAHPLEVTVADDSGADVAFVVCQDFDRNGSCGETHEPFVITCGGSIALNQSSVVFRSDYPTLVFLQNQGPTCTSFPYHGTVTLTTG